MPEHPLGACSACPVRAAGLDHPCPCRKNPRLAELFNADPEKQGPRLAALAPVLASWPDAGPREPRPAAGMAARRAAPGSLDLLLVGYLAAHTFYGQFCAVIARGLAARGLRVGVISAGGDTGPLGMAPGLDRFLSDGDPGDCPVLQLTVPFHPPMPGRKVARFTMWECSRVNEHSVRALNGIDLILTPSAWNAEVFRESGATTRAEIVPLGLDLADGYDTAASRDAAGRFITAMAGNTAHGGVRKNLDAGVAAWIEALGDRPDCLLRVKVQPGAGVETRGHPRVEVHDAALTPKEMARWYDGADVLLVPSRGEGWGKHTQEAMCRGVVPVAALWGGTAAVCDERTCLPLDYTLEPAGEFYADTGGLWCVPSHGSMVAQLRWAYGHRHELDAMRPACMARGRSFTWDRMLDGIEAALRGAGMWPKAPSASPQPAPAAPSPSPAPNPHMARVAAVRACPHRTALARTCGCQGEKATCALGRTTFDREPGVAYFSTCLECVKEREGTA